MDRYALFISCEEYAEFKDIYYCHSDAVLIWETLGAYCDYDRSKSQILTLYREAEEGKAESIYQMLKDLTRNMSQDDTFLFYFAGHGMVEGEDEFLILPDTKLSNIRETSLSLKKINEILKDCTGSTFKIIDACHSGKDVRGTETNNFCKNIIKNSWGTLASCAEDEYSYPDSDLQQGVFSYYVAEEIKKWELETDINLETLKICVCSDLEEWGKKSGVVQTPTLNGSLVGNVAFATRNKKEYEYAIINRSDILSDAKEESVMEEMELSVVNNTDIALWEPNAGIEIPKSADALQVLELNMQVKPQIVKAVYTNFMNEDYEVAVEALWNRTIAILKKRVLALGEEFVGEMVGIDNLEYIRALPEFEVINLAMELGFINNTGKMRLMHAYETITHYCEENTNSEMIKSEAESVIRACVQYVIGFDEADVVIEYNDFRESLKLERFDADSAKMEMLKNSPYFYKKTTVRTFVNLISTTEGAEFENVIANFNIGLPIIWESLSADDKYFIGITYSKYVNNGDKKYVIPIKEVLVKVGGFDYVPENLRSLSFIKVAKRIKSVHYALNNFYNEPSVVIELERMGTQIPKPAIKECISAILMVLMGNAYGRSRAAVEPAEKVLSKLTESEWKYYIKECLPYDETVLSKMRAGDERTMYWCDIIKKFGLDRYDFGNTKINEFIAYSVKGDRHNVKAIAGMYLKKLGSE